MKLAVSVLGWEWVFELSRVADEPAGERVSNTGGIFEPAEADVESVAVFGFEVR